MPQKMNEVIKKLAEAKGLDLVVDAQPPFLQNRIGYHRGRDRRVR